MPIWLIIFIFIISCVILVRSGSWVVKSLVRVGQFLGWREFIVSSIIMAFATSLPELFIGISSAFQGSSSLGLGNVIGSNIINLTIVIGIIVLFSTKLSAHGTTLKRSVLLATVLSTLPIILMLDGEISRADGIVLLLGFLIYFGNLFRREERFSKVLREQFQRIGARFGAFIKDIGLFLLGIALLLISAEGIVWSAKTLAIAGGIPFILIGALIIAIGTNLPEITFGIKAVNLKHSNMVLGNIMGSVAANSTLILGITFIISPLKIPYINPYIIGAIFTTLVALLFFIFSRTKQEINKKEGAFLIITYALFVTAEILIS